MDSAMVKKCQTPTSPGVQTEEKEWLNAVLSGASDSSFEGFEVICIQRSLQPSLNGVG